jgi:hypothetical protein
MESETWDRNERSRLQQALALPMLKNPRTNVGRILTDSDDSGKAFCKLFCQRGRNPIHADSKQEDYPCRGRRIR